MPRPCRLSVPEHRWRQRGCLGTPGCGLSSATRSPPQPLCRKFSFHQFLPLMPLRSACQRLGPPTNCSPGNDHIIQNVNQIALAPHLNSSLSPRSLRATIGSRRVHAKECPSPIRPASALPRGHRSANARGTHHLQCRWALCTPASTHPLAASSPASNLPTPARVQKSPGWLCPPVGKGSPLRVGQCLRCCTSYCAQCLLSHRIL